MDLSNYESAEALTYAGIRLTRIANRTFQRVLCTFFFMKTFFWFNIDWSEMPQCSISFIYSSQETEKN